MSGPGSQEPVGVKLRTKSWGQLAHLYERDIKQGKLFLKTGKPPPMGTRIQINLGLPSDSTVMLIGSVTEHIGAAGMGGRGPGVMLALDALPYTAQWLLESSIAAAVKAGKAAAPVPSAESEPAMSDHQDVAKAEDLLVASLKEELGTLRKLNPFQLLEVPYDTTDEAVRRAFGALTKRYHPDRFARYGSVEAKNIGAEIFLLLRDAYAAISEAEPRARAVDKLRGGVVDPPSRQAAAKAATPAPQPATPPAVPTRAPAPTPPRSPAPPAQARPAAPPAPPAARPAPPPPPPPPPQPTAEGPNRLDGLLAAGHYDEALREAQVQARRNAGNRQLRAMVELCEGLRAMASDDRLEAAQRFEATLELDPENEHAIRGLAQIRRRATEERKGFLGRLLTNKD